MSWIASPWAMATDQGRMAVVPWQVYLTMPLWISEDSSWHLQPETQATKYLQTAIGTTAGLSGQTPFPVKTFKTEQGWLPYLKQSKDGEGDGWKTSAAIHPANLLEQPCC